MLAIFPVLLLGGVVELTGPARAPGNPDAPIALSLTVDAAGARGGKVTLSADAGTLGTPRELAPESFEVTFTPPRVAAPTAVTVSAALPGGRERSSWVITVDPVEEAAAEIVSAGALAMRAPGRIVIGSGTPVKVRVRSVSAEPPAITASVGTLSAPVPDGAGGFELELTPPASGPPRVALLTAWSGAEVDLLAVPVAGTAKVSVATDRRAAVTLQVGGQSFGPFGSIPGKSMIVPLVVPVGVSDYTSTAVGADGIPTRKTLALGVPSPRALHLLASPDASRILAVSIGPDGNVDPSAKVTLTVSSGTLAERTDGVLPGAVVWEHAPDENARPGDRVELTARAGDFTVTQSMSLPARAPAAIAVSVEPGTWSPGRGPVQVTVELRGPGPFADEPVEVLPSAGNVSALVFSGRRASAEWIPPDALPASRSAELVVRRGGGTGRAVLGLQSGPIAQLEIEPERKSVRGDGQSEARLRVVARDAAGNAAGPEAVELSANGTTSTLTAQPDGSLSATYRPSRTTRRAEETIIVRAPGAEARTTMVVLPERAPLTAGASAGFVSNLGRISAPYTMLEVQAGIPRVPPLAVAIAAGYYKSRSRVAFPELDETGDLALEVIPITLTATWRRRVGGAADVYGGGGLGVFVARTGLRSASSGERTSVTSPVGGSVLAGIEIASGPGRLFGEVGYWEARASGSVHGSLGGARAAAGYRYAF